jgi:hypothetical protein
LACMRYFGVGAEEPGAAENIDTDDFEILENYLERERGRRTPGQAPSPPTKTG